MGKAGIRPASAAQKAEAEKFRNEEAWNKPGDRQMAALRAASTLEGQLRVSPDYVTIRLASDGVHLMLRPGAHAPINPDPAVPLIIRAC